MSRKPDVPRIMRGLLNIGDLVKTSMISEELESAIGSLVDSEKCQYHFIPPKSIKTQVCN